MGDKEENKNDDDDGDTEEATKDTADAKEPISINEADGKPNYLKSTKKNDDDANEEITVKEEKLSHQLKAKLIGAKANLTTFLMKNKKDVQNKEGKESSKETDQMKDESSASSKSQTQVANLAVTSSKENTLVGFMATAETASKNALENARDAFQRATSKRRVSIVTKDLKSDVNKKQFEEEQKETDKEETPVVEN